MSPTTLHPATLASIPLLADISNLAFATDAHTRLKTLATGISHATDMLPALHHWVSSDHHRLLIAVTATGDIAGWICWGFRGVTAPALLPSSAVEFPEPPPATGVEQQLEEGKAIRPKIQELEELTSSHLMAAIPPSSTTPSCLILIAISVSPQYQGLGVGHQLVGYGTAIADQEKVICWVSSSDGGTGFFEREGFDKVGQLEVDLGEYAEDLKIEEKWGHYVWRYLVREPKNVAKDALIH